MLRGLLLVLTLVPLASAANDTNATTDDGLSGGAVAGIIIGSLLVVSVIGAAVWHYQCRPKVRYPLIKFPGSAASGSAATTDAKATDNHLPMVAVRVNVDDDL